MALGKLASLKLSNATETIVMDNLSVGFRVYRSNKRTMNTAEFNVRNLSDATIKDFLNAGTTVAFKAGWADQNRGALSTVFIGNVLRQAEVKREGVDRMLTIFSGSMANIAGINEKKLKDAAEKASQGIENPTLRKAARESARAQQARILNAGGFAVRLTCSLTYARDYAISSILEDLFVGILGLSLNGLSEIANLKLSAPFVHQGSVHLAVKRLTYILQGFGYTLFIDNVDCRVHHMTNPIGLLTVGLVSWTTGLVSLGELVDYTEDLSANEDQAPSRMLKLTCLLNPSYQPNGILHVKTPEVNGDFLIESVEFYGDNQEGEFLCDCTVSEHKRK